MFEVRVGNNRQQCAFAETVSEAVQALQSITPSTEDIYVYEFQSQLLVKVLKYH
jgi:hypothetical protein